jgi:guanine deaminase
MRPRRYSGGMPAALPPASADAAPALPARALRGSILHFLRDPGASDDAESWQYVDDGLLVVDGASGRVLDCGDHAALAPRWLQRGAPVDDWRGHLIVPGFVDAHVHGGQMEVIASYGTQLLDWLERYTFPAEARFADRGHSARMAAWFCDTLLAHGTTTAAVLPTVHAASVDTLFEAASLRNMRVLAGKVMMDRHAPAALCDADLGACERACRDLIERWHGRGRLGYLVTPRFAPTSSDAQLRLAGELAGAYGLAVQSHLAENRAEVAWVAELFAALGCRSYAEVYAHYGLLRPGSVYAHGIWLDDADRRLLAAQGTAIAFCPTSNLFIGSGLFDLAAADRAAMPVALATDVGGGTSYGMLQTMAEAYKVLQLQGQNLSPWRAFYLATRGGARALGLDGRIGSFEPGREADAVVLRWAHGAVQRLRQDAAHTTAERLFVLMTLGTQANVAATYLLGQPAYRDAEPR